MKVPEHFTARIAGNLYRDTSQLVVCQGTPLLTVKRSDKTGELLVELEIFDSDGRQRARVKGTKVTGKRSGDIAVSLTEQTYAVYDKVNERMICELQRRSAARDMDIDVFLLAHGPDGFFVHVSPVQTNLRTKGTGKVYEDQESALVLN
jgi:hypothetical protein